MFMNATLDVNNVDVNTTLKTDSQHFSQSLLNLKSNVPNFRATTTDNMSLSTIVW